MTRLAFLLVLGCALALAVSFAAAELGDCVAGVP